MSRLLHVIKATRIAGAETHLLALLPGLQAAGLEVELALLEESARPMDDYAAALEAAGVTVHRLAINRHLDLTLIARLARLMRAGRYDAVHTHLLHADFYGNLAAGAAGIERRLSSRHNDNPFRRRWPFRLLHRWLWRRCCAGIAISAYLRRFCLQVEGAPAGRLYTVYYGLEPGADAARAGRAAARAQLGLAPETPVLGTVCRLVEQKGVVYALRAFREAAARFPTALLLVVGDGPLRPALEAEAATLGLGEQVRFLGWRQDAPQAIIAALDALLAPSLWEGLGLVALEAMGQGTPVIASRVSALPELIVDGETGLLTTPGDVDALAAAMLRLLTHPAEARRLGAAGYARLREQFSPARMIEGTLAVYRRCGI